MHVFFSFSIHCNLCCSLNIPNFFRSFFPSTLFFPGSLKLPLFYFSCFRKPSGFFHIIDHFLLRPFSEYYLHLILSCKLFFDPVKTNFPYLSLAFAHSNKKLIPLMHFDEAK